MSYVEWKHVASRQEARRSGKPWQKIETYEADSPAGAEPIKESYRVGIEKCSHHDGLVCGGTREKHPMICSCWGTGVIIKSKHGDHEYEGHEFT